MGRIKNQLLFTGFLVFTYLVFGTWFFSWQEGWRAFDAFYFSAVTLTTVGYGDFLPSTDISKLMAIFFAFSGISIIFYSLSLLAREYFESQEEKFDNIRHLPHQMFRKNEVKQTRTIRDIATQTHKSNSSLNIKKMTASQLMQSTENKHKSK